MRRVEMWACKVLDLRHGCLASGVGGAEAKAFPDEKSPQHPSS